MTSDSGGAFGDYAGERTLLLASVAAEGAEADCGVPEPPVASAMAYRVTGTESAAVVLDVVGGCRLGARVSGGVLIADGAACGLSEDTTLYRFGLVSRIYHTFRLTYATNRLVDRCTSLWDTNEGRLRLCAVSEGRVGSLGGAPGVVVFRYEASYSRTAELPSSAQECGTVAFQGPASGYMTLPAEATSLRFDGWGCNLEVRRGSDGVLTGTSETCQPDGSVSFTGIGVQTLTFDTFRLDPGGHTLKASGRMVRATAVGAVTSCLTLDGTVAER